MKNTHLSHTVLAAAAFLAGLYGSTAWSLLSRSQRVTSTPAVDATSAVNCHGLKHLPEKHLLFAACRDGIEDGRERRFGDLIHVIDPTSHESVTKRLDFENFKGPLVAQSLDVITDPDNTRAVYIHVVNQIPAGPQIEIFRHVLGTPSIQHVRSIKHPLVGLSSHLVASSPMSFFITGSHADSDVITEASISHSAHADDRAGWSSVVHVEVGNLGATTNPSRSVTTSIAFTGSARSQDINQGMTEEELDYPLEWLTGEDVPPCALTAQKAVSSSRLMKLRDCVRLAAGLGSPGF